MYDFEHFQAVLRGGARDWVPPAELGVDREVKEAFLGQRIEGPGDEVKFWREAGYCYVGVRVWPGFVEPFDVLQPGIMQSHSHAYTAYGDHRAERQWAPEGKGCITSWRDFEEFPWPSADSGHYAEFAEASRHLPSAMKIIATEGRIFQITWMLMGFEGFATALAEEPELVYAVMDKIAALRLEGFQRVIGLEAVGAGWLPDDIAYSEGLFASPRFFREHLFLWYRRFGDICRQLGKPLIYHSDGRLWEVLEDLIECGFSALHPIEPKAMEAVEVKRRVAGRLCLIGNVELDRLARGTPEEIRNLVRERIEVLAPGGGYCVGSSNSVAHYVPLDNYRALLEASHLYGRQRPS